MNTVEGSRIRMRIAGVRIVLATLAGHPHTKVMHERIQSALRDLDDIERLTRANDPTPRPLPSFKETRP